MSEPLSQVIRLRVTHTQAARLQQSAAIAGLSLSDYLRRRLLEADSVSDEIKLLRESAEQLQHLAQLRAASMEALLLIRGHSEPSNVTHARACVQALGLKPTPYDS